MRAAIIENWPKFRPVVKSHPHSFALALLQGCEFRRATSTAIIARINYNTCGAYLATAQPQICTQCIRIEDDFHYTGIGWLSAWLTDLPVMNVAY